MAEEFPLPVPSDRLPEPTDQGALLEAAYEGIMSESGVGIANECGGCT